MNAIRSAGGLAVGSLLVALLPVTAGAQVNAPLPPADLVPPSFVTAPVLTPNPNEWAPLAARITFQTDEPTTIELGIRDGQRSWYVLAEPEPKTDHVVAVLGVHFDRTHLITVTASDAAGNKTTSGEVLVFVTPPTPPQTPPYQLVTAQPDLMEPGVTLMNVGIDRYNPTFLIMVDQNAEIVWYYQTDWFSGDVRRLRNGNMLLIGGRFTVAEIDMFGDIVHEWYANDLWPDRAPPGATLVDTDTFHHEVFEMPANDPADFAVISTELRVYPDYPADEVDPTQTVPSSNVIADTIVEFTRDGTIVRELKLADILDPYRICYDGLFGFWDTQYALDQTDDWAHANAVIYDPYDDSYVVSLRHQEAVVKIDRTTEQIAWILGPHERWRPEFQQYLLTPVGEGFEWNYHQHAPEWTFDGTLLLFDNGNQRAMPPDPKLPFDQRWSRAIEFAIDPVAMTVEEVWAFGGPPPAEQFYSNTRGDADHQIQTGNILVTDSDRAATQMGGAGWSRIVEVSHSDPPQVVFDLHMRDDDLSDGATPWNAYRCERVSGVYPHE